MQIVEAVAVRRGICGCGYSLLRDEIPLGRVYRLDVDVTEPGLCFCPGCNSIHALLLVLCVGDSVGGWLTGMMPVDILSPEIADICRASEAVGVVN